MVDAKYDTCKMFKTQDSQTVAPVENSYLKVAEKPYATASAFFGSFKNPPSLLVSELSTARLVCCMLIIFGSYV